MLQQVVSKVMAEMEDQERDAKRNANNITVDNFSQSPVTTNTQGRIANVTNERQISSDILADTIKVFKGLTLQSIINNSAYYNSEEDDTERHPNRNPKVATHTSDGKKRKVTNDDTTNGNCTHKLSINRLTQEIISVVIPLIDQLTADEVAASGGDLHARRTIISKDIITDAARSAAHFSNILWW